MIQKHKGAASELLASIWLMGQGYDVFRNVSQYGLFDIVAFKNDELIKIDVKTGHYSGESFNYPRPSEDHIKNNVKLLIVNLNTMQVHGWHEMTKTPEASLKKCVICGKVESAASRTHWETLCSHECRRENHRRKYRSGKFEQRVNYALQE